MTTLINADTVTGGAVITGDASGQLALQAAGVTQLTVSSSGVTIPTLIGANVNLTSNVTGTLPVLSGGTGATTLATNSVLLGNNGSPVQTVAPGASGNLLTSNGTTWASTAPAAAGGTITATSTGSITAGNAIQVNSNGTVSAPTLTYANTATTVASLDPAVGTGSATLTYCESVDKYVMSYMRYVDAYPCFIVGTPSASGITWSTETVLNAAAASYRQRAVYVPSQGVVIVSFTQGTAQFLRAIKVNADGSSTMGTTVTGFPVGTLGSGNAYGLAYNTTQEKLMSVGPNNNNGGYLASCLFTVVGTTITNVSNVTNILSTYTNNDPYLFYDPLSDRFVIIGNYTSGYQYGWIGTVSGTTTSWASPQLISTITSTTNTSSVYDSTSQKTILSWFPNDSAQRTATLTIPGGSSFSLGAVTSFSVTNNQNVSLTYDSGLNRIVYLYPNTPSEYPTVVTGTVSGTSISIGSPTVLQSVYSAPSYYMLCRYSSAQKYSICIWWTAGNAARSSAVTIGSSSLTANNFIGFSESTVSTGQPTIVTVSGGANNNQTGLTPALKYYVQPTGSLSTSTSSLYGGISLSATKLLVKG